jgi:gamma-glutamyl-gamma-aminobutyrate hydrolase PuuD
MARPRIGVTAGHLLGAGGPKQRQERYIGCARDFVAAVERAGAAALLFPPSAQRELVRAMLDSVDGLLLTGGGDVDSLSFGAEPHPSIRLIDPPRDRMEIDAIRLAVQREMPVLGICRGIQMLNVALGGGLVQDIAAEVDKPVRHWNADLGDCLSHTVTVEAPSLLASLLGGGKVRVNSYHHQAVGRLAKGLRATAWAADGVIEALEAAKGRPVLGVQFHPEEVAGEHAPFQTLFDWLVREARRYRRRQRRPR